MLTVITKPRKIRAATKAFRDQLRAAADKPVKHLIGYPGGSEEGRVWVLPRHDFFWCLLASGDPENRCWNGFGHVMPGERTVLPLDVEVNVPWEGINRRVAGLFLEGPRGEVYLGHRGRIGGGRRGVGKSAFWDRYADQAQPVRDDEPVVVLGRVGSPKFLTDLATFIRNVADIKLEATGASAGDDLDAADGQEIAEALPFSPEFEGTKTLTIARTIEARCHHGTIVRQLCDALQALGWTAGNDRARDLVGCPSPGARPVTFEVKTDITSQSIFTGVGQLVINAQPRSSGDAAVLVVPDDFARATERLLAAEGIHVLRFRWKDDATIEFENLATVAASAAASARATR